MKLKTRAAHKELEYESTRMAACLCAAVDAVKQAEAHAAKKDSAVRFTSDNISSIGLSLYIRRRDDKKEFSKA